MGSPHIASRGQCPFFFKNVFIWLCQVLGFPGGTSVENLPANAGDKGDVGVIPGSGRYPGVENGSPFQFSFLENPMDRGAWQAIIHGVAKSRIQLSDYAIRMRALGLTCGMWDLAP